MKTQCALCHGNMTDNATTCRKCAEKLDRALGDVAARTTIEKHVDPTIGVRRKHHRPSLLAELELSRTRQSRATTSVGPRSTAETPIPYDDRARRAGDQLIRSLATWARRALDAGREGGKLTDTSASGVARFLLHHVDWLRHQPDGDKAIIEITTAVQRAKHVIDREPVRAWAGPCRAELDTSPNGTIIECEQELWIVEHAQVVTCPACGTEWDTAGRREYLLLWAQDTLSFAERIADGLTSMGMPVTSAMIRGYALRGRILAHDIDLKKRPLYRVGDVVDIVQQTMSERARKAAKHATRRATTRSA